VAQLYFHCSNSQGVMIDQRGTAIGNLAEARDHAARIVGSLVMGRSSEDWRDWMLHVSDDLDEEVFVLPFASVVGRLN
jgi:hypothetical protein